MSASGGGKGGGGKTRNRGSASTGAAKSQDKASSATNTTDSSQVNKSPTLARSTDKSRQTNEGGAKTGTDTVHKIMPTAEQLRIAQMISDPKKEDPDLLDKINKLVEVTGRSADSVTIALHDCNNDLERATILLLDGEGEGDWEVSGKKKKGRLAAKAGHEGGDADQGQSAGRERDREHQGDRDRSRSARGPPRMRGRGRGKENKERDEWNEGVGDASSSDYSGTRGGRGGRGGRMVNGRGRGGGGGRGRGYGGRGGGPGRGMRNSSQPEDSWDTPTDQEPMKMDNWGEDFPATEDWDNEEYTGSLADTKVFTPSSQIAPPIAADPTSQAGAGVAAGTVGAGLLNGEVPTAELPAVTPAPAPGHVLYRAVASNQANVPSSSQAPITSSTAATGVPAGTPLDLSVLLQKEPGNVNAYLSQYSQPSATPGSFLGYNTVAGGAPSSVNSAANAAAAAAARNKPQRPKLAPPSKIPASAVEMPNDDAVNQLDLKFGSLDFGVGVESTGFELTPLQQQQSLAAHQQAQSQATSTAGLLDTESSATGLGVSNAAANLGTPGDYGNKGASSLGNTSAMPKAGENSSASALGGTTGGYGSSHQTATTTSYPYQQGPKSSYGTGYNAYGQGYSSTSSSAAASSYGSSHQQQQQQQPASTATSTPYGSSSYGYGNTGPSSNTSTAPSSAYPASGVYNPAAAGAGSKKDVPTSATGAQGVGQVQAGYDSNTGGSSVPSTTLSMQALGLGTSNVPSRSAANSGAGPTSKTIPTASSSATVLSALQAPSVAPTSQPGLPAGTLLGAQYIMGGPGPGMPFYPANLQQPMYSLEDMQLFQQRYPHMSNAELAAAYYGVGYQSPTSLTAAATPGTRDTSVASQGLASMAYDNKFARPENNSPVPTSLSQSAAAQTHQAAYLSAAAAAAAAPLPPAYAYFYGGGVVPGGFQYGPAPTALYPVSAPSSAQGQGHVQTPSGHMGAGQYGKGPGGPSQQQTPNTGVGSSGPSAYNYASTYEALSNSDFKSIYGGGSVGVGAAGGASGVVPNKVGSSTGPGSATADLGSVYGKAAPHSQLSKVSYDKPGFHTGTPPPFNLAAPGSGTGPGAYTQMFIPTLAPHQSHHSQLMHAQLHQDTGAGGQRSATGGQSGTKTGPKGSYGASYWGNN